MTLLGAGQVFGDADIIKDRNYKATMTCTKNDSFVYAMVKVDFLRFFKKTGDSWHVLWDLSKKQDEIDNN